MDINLLSQLLGSIGSGMARTNSYGGGLGLGADEFRQKQQYSQTLDSLFGTPQVGVSKPIPQSMPQQPQSLTDTSISPQTLESITPKLSTNYDGPLGGAAGMLPLLKGVDPSIGMPLLLKMATTQSEFDPTPRYDQSGRAFLVGKNGTVKYLDGVQDRPDVKVENGIAYDPHKTPAGTVFNDPNKAFNPDGTPNPDYQQYEQGLRVAGRPVTSVNVNANKSFGTALGDQAAKILDNSKAAADGGIKTIATVNQLRSALDTGKVSAGPGATFGQVFRQISGGDEGKIVATRQAIQGLAQLTLAARGQMKGQGQISDYEGKLLQKATSGDIDSMTVPEIKAIADVADRAARVSIRANKANVDKARKVAGSDSSIVDFYNVDEPPAYSTAAPAGPKTLHYNPQTGRLE